MNRFSSPLSGDSSENFPWETGEGADAPDVNTLLPDFLRSRFRDRAQNAASDSRSGATETVNEKNVGEEIAFVGTLELEESVAAGVSDFVHTLNERGVLTPNVEWRNLLKEDLSLIQRLPIAKGDRAYQEQRLVSSYLLGFYNPHAREGGSRKRMHQLAHYIMESGPPEQNEQSKRDWHSISVCITVMADQSPDRKPGQPPAMPHWLGREIPKLSEDELSPDAREELSFLRNLAETPWEAKVFESSLNSAVYDEQFHPARQHRRDLQENVDILHSIPLNDRVRRTRLIYPITGYLEGTYRPAPQGRKDDLRRRIQKMKDEGVYLDTLAVHPLDQDENGNSVIFSYFSDLRKGSL